MPEKLTLTTPTTPTAPTTSEYAPRSVYLGWDEAVIRFVVRDNNAVTVTCVWEGTDATNTMIAINKANLTTLSLIKRLLQKAVTDGKLPSGSVTGTPD